MISQLFDEICQKSLNRKLLTKPKVGRIQDIFEKNSFDYTQIILSLDGARFSLEQSKLENYSWDLLPTPGFEPIRERKQSVQIFSPIGSRDS